MLNSSDWKKRRRIQMQPAELGIRDCLLLGRYNHVSAMQELRPHAHPAAMEICHLVRGRQIYEVGGEHFPMVGGDLFVTFPGEVHSTDQLPQEKGILYWLILRLPKDGPLLELPSEESHGLREALKELPERLFRGNARVTEILDEMMVQLLQPVTALGSLRIRTRLQDFLLEVIQLANAPLPAKPPSGRGLGRVLTHIDRHLDDPLEIPRLAEIAGLSVPQFQARFKAQFGVPPGEYVLRTKIEEATRRLQESRRPITHIAFDLGFGSSQYFSTVVKKFTGQTPSEIRAGNQAP